MTAVRDIPTVFTPPGGYGDHGTDRYDRAMPPPILAACDEPIVPGAPDLRGTWRAVDVRSNGAPVPVDGDGPVGGMWRHTERIEQAGERVVITSGGVIHDFAACDGTAEHGVHDVMAVDFVTPIVVAASYEDGVLVLRPEGVPGVEVKRWREGEHLIWEYSVLATVRLERIDASD